MENCKKSFKSAVTSLLDLGQGSKPLRIMVLGDKSVGKSAFTVRYLTGRYIGEYKSDLDILYRQTVMTGPKTSLDLEILDCSSLKTLEKVGAVIPDAYVVLYSITDRNSFDVASKVLHKISHSRKNKCFLDQNMNLGTQTPSESLENNIVLLGNKKDLEHSRKISKSEGSKLASNYGVQFNEISVAENSIEIYDELQSLVSILLFKSSSISHVGIPGIMKFVKKLVLAKEAHMPPNLCRGRAKIVSTF